MNKTYASLLSARLKRIFSYIDFSLPLADIGADHGLLALSLSEAGFKEELVVTEKGNGPYKTLSKAIADSPFSSKIQVFQGDGLQALANKPVQICLSGMGGLTIKAILEGDREKASSLKRIICEPQKEFNEVRSFFQKKGFRAEKESYICEKGHYYPVIAYVKGKEALDADELEYGAGPLKEKDPLLIEKLKKTVSIYTGLLSDEAVPPAKKKRVGEELEKVLGILKKLGIN